MREPGEGAGQSLCDRRLGLPGAGRAQPGRVNDRAFLLTGLGVGVHDLDLERRGIEQSPRQLVHIGLLALADVEAADQSVLQGERIGMNDVFNIYIVSGLISIAEYLYLFAIKNTGAEDRDDACFAMGVLSGSEDVAVAQCCVRYFIESMIPFEVLLADGLRQAVRALGAHGVGFCGWEGVLFAVHGPARRGEEDMLQGAGGAPSLHDIEQAHNVDVGVEGRQRHALANIHLGGVQTQHLGCKGSDRGGGHGAAHVGDDEAGARVDLGAKPRREVVDDDDVIAVSDEAVDEVGTNEAGAAGDKNSHGRNLLLAEGEILFRCQRRSRGGGRPVQERIARGLCAGRGCAHLTWALTGRRFRHMRRLVILGFIAAVSGPGGCASDGEKTGAGDLASQAADDGAERITDEDVDLSSLSRRDLDLNKDGKADAYQFISLVDNQQLIVRKEIDVNFDGKIDMIRKMNEKGDLVEERVDADFDGRIDLVVTFQKGSIVKKTYDTNFDQKSDMWRFFEQGAIVREEADLNYDGKVDFWEYYEGGSLDRIGVDRDGDGNVDDWQSKDAT